MTDVQKKRFKIVIIILSILLIGELLFFGIKLYTTRKNNVFNTVINSVILQDNKNYLGAGFSDYRHSKFNKFDKGYDKATLFSVKKGSLVNEISLPIGYNSRFNDVVEVSDGYIAVGKVEMTKEHIKEKMSEGLIVKYDKKFKVVWRKNIAILGNTELLKIKADGDNVVIVGTSVYSSGYVGNHTTGGGILLKYDNSGKELLRINNGGPYNGRFNDVLIESDSYVVVGLGKKNSGIIISYDKAGKKKWSGSFGYTDNNGINAIAKKGNDYVVATTKVVNPKDMSSYSAAVVIFDSHGEKIDDVKYSDNNLNYFSDIELDDEGNIYVCGYTGYNEGRNILGDALLVKYDKDLYEKEVAVVKGSKNDFYSKLYIKSGNIYALGNTTSKLKGFKTNGYDYYPFIKKYNMKLK